MKSRLKMKNCISLLNRDLTLYRKTLLIYFMVAVMITMFFIYIFPVAMQRGMPNYMSYGVNVPVIIGLLVILIGFSFTDLDSSGKKISYLLLPSTALEKYMTRFLSTLIGYSIIFMLIYIIDSLFVKILNISSVYGTGNSYELFRQSEQVKTYLQFYIMLHAIFFYGAVAFNKNSFLKTALVVFIIVAAVLFLLKVLVWIFLPNVSVSLFLRLDTEVFYYSEEAYKKFESYRNVLGSVMGFIAFYITPPFLWVLGYFRLKEEEVENGVQ